MLQELLHQLRNILLQPRNRHTTDNIQEGFDLSPPDFGRSVSILNRRVLHDS
jgi:hypothetical protein